MMSVGLLGDVVGVVRHRICVRAAPCLLYFSLHCCYLITRLLFS